MLNVVKTAIPVAPVTALSVPESVPPPDPMAKVIGMPTANEPFALSARTDTAGSIACPNTTVLGWVTNARLTVPAGEIVMLNARVATCCGADESSTCTTNGEVPAVVGVPEMTPLGLNVSPGGSRPDARLQN